MKRTTMRTAASVIAFLLVMLACATAAITASAETEIEKIELCGTFEIEAGMAVPDDIRAPEDAPYTVSAWWNHYDDEAGEYVTTEGVFELGNYYYLDLSIIPKEGYCFPDRSIYLELNGEKYDTVWPNSHMATYYFYFDLNPVIREAAVSYSEITAGMNTNDTVISIPEGVQYTASCEWKKYNEEIYDYEPYSGVLETGYKYVLTLNLTPAEGWSFDTYNISLTVNGEYVYAYPYDGVLSYDAEIDLRTQIEYVDLLGVTEPAVGETATVEGIYIPQNAPYTLESVRITTLDRDISEHVDFTGVFGYGTEYTLIAEFKAADGATFADNEVNVYINGTCVTYAYGEEDSLYVYYDYKFTRQVDRVDVTGVVPVVVGGTASIDGITAPADAPYYVSYTYWNEYEKGKGYTRFNGGTFRSGMKYELAINVDISDSEYTFSENAAVYVNGEPAHVAHVNDTSIYIYQHTATAPTVSEVGIVGFIMPEYGASTSLAGVSTVGDGYSISEIRWNEEYADGEYADVCSPTFTEGCKYSLYIDFELDDEYFFAYDCIFTINGEEYEYYRMGNEYFTVYHEFDLGGGSEPEPILGDADGDGVLTNADILLSVRYLCGWDVEADSALLDMDGNGKVNNRDIIALIKTIA